MNTKYLTKKASAGSDMLLGALSPLNVVTQPFATYAGIIHGYTADTKDEDLAAMNESPLKAALPGVAYSRVVRRQIAAPGSSKERVLVSRGVNPFGPLLLFAAMGGSLGALRGLYEKSSAKGLMYNALTGATFGGAAGGILSIGGTLGGALAGLNAREKTKEEHEEAERNYSKARAFVDPFYNGYQMGRRLQASNIPRVSKEEHNDTSLTPKV